LENPVLIAMEDAPGKPDPTGLFLSVELIEKKYALSKSLPVIYLGDTVADMQTIVKAQAIQPQRKWTGIGVLPPHIHSNISISPRYTEQLKHFGATEVVKQVIDFTNI
jgi:HAD superfamily phosphatase